MKKSNSELKFSALKIKKIIQENKEIGSKRRFSENKWRSHKVYMEIFARDVEE